MADKDFIKDVFQRATEEFDIEFNPIAWERMEKKLNRARRRRVLFYWLRWGGLALVVLVSAWLFWQKFIILESKPNVTKPNMPVVEVPKAGEEFCPENELASINKEKLENKKLKSEKINNENLLRNKFQNNNTKSQREERSTVYRIDKQVNESQINSNKIVLEKEQVKNNVEIIDSVHNNLSKSSNNFTFYNTEAIAALELSTLTFKKPNETIVIPQPLNDSTDVIKSNPLQQNRLTVGLLFAPETVSVGFNDDARNGYSFGLLTEYRFANRFSVSAQGLYAKKNYVAGKGEYTRPGGWPNDVAPIQTIGNCEMIEATLGLRTELLQRQRWNLVANTGVSTWWMLQEGYKYKYERHDPSFIYKWKSKETITHWLGVAQLGIGSEFKLSQRMSVQADLYMQVPLQGLGHGKLQLYSNGLSFSLRRHF